MAKTTIMLADMPAMLRDILVRALSRYPDITPIPAPAQGSLIAALAAAKVDAVVVVNRNPAALKAVDPALARIASLSVLVLSPDGQSACIHRIRSETQVLTDVTPQGIVDALAGAVEAKPRRPK